MNSPVEPAAAGPPRALALIDRLAGPDGGQPAAFARILVGLFPPWFDFGPDKFAVLAWGRGLHLVVSGSEYGFALLSTSDSRIMSCTVVGRTVEGARMDLHYTPHPDQVERARAVIGLAVHHLFPERGAAPVPAGVTVPPGRVFPPAWGGRFADAGGA